MSLIVDEIRLTNDAVRYGFAVGKVRVLETRAIDHGALERLLDANTFGQQKRLLSDTPYGRFLEGAETAEEIERALDEALESWLEFLGQAELPSDVADFFRVQYDYDNLRAAAKAGVLGASLDGLLTPHGLVPIEAFTSDLPALPGRLGELARSLPLEADDETSASEATRLIDLIVDAAVFAEMLRLAHGSKSKFLIEFTKIRIDLANVRVLVRGAIAALGSDRIRAALVEGGSISAASLGPIAGLDLDQVIEAVRARPELRALPETDLGNPGLLDTALDSLALQALERGRRGPIGPEPVIAYVLARQVEVAVIRVLLLGGLAGIDSEVLRERVNAVRG